MYDVRIRVEIRQYAAYIGVNLPEEQYMWELVKEGVMTSLPAGWEACQTPQGEIVYRNVKTRQVQEQHPMDQVYRQKVIELRQAYNKYEGMQSSDQQLNTIPEQKSQQRSLKDNSQLDQAMMPSKELYSPSNILKQEWNSSLNLNQNLNKGMIQHETNSKDLQPQQNSKMLANLSVDQTNRLYSYQSQSYSERDKKKNSEESVQIQKQRLKKELEMLLKQERLAGQLLEELKKDNMRRMQRIKKRNEKKNQSQKNDKKTKQ